MILCSITFLQFFPVNILKIWGKMKNFNINIPFVVTNPAVALDPFLNYTA